MGAILNSLIVKVSGKTNVQILLHCSRANDRLVRNIISIFWYIGISILFLKTSNTYKCFYFNFSIKEQYKQLLVYVFNAVVRTKLCLINLMVYKGFQNANMWRFALDVLLCFIIQWIYTQWSLFILKEVLFSKCIEKVFLFPSNS